MVETWTVEHFYAVIREAELKPTKVPTVFRDAEGAVWHVFDPRPMTPDERRAFFERLERLRGRR